jgi:hypothetical protein
MNWLALVLLFAAPFWASRPPAEWSETELETLFSESPWAQPLTGPRNATGVIAYFATAKPMEEGEHELERRAKKKPPPDPLLEEYRAWLNENRDTQIVLAIPIGENKAYSDAKETRRMEEECVMKVGRKKFKLTGHFPPTRGDAHLRLAFPREVTSADKSVSFDLYVPGIAIPFRSVEFQVKDLIVNGKLEM